MARPGASQPGYKRPQDPHRHVRKVRGRAVRARLRRHHRQRSAAHSAVEPRRQRHHANQGAGRPARVHHAAGRCRGHDRRRTERQIVGGEEPHRRDQGRAHREDDPRRGHRRRRADGRLGGSDQQGSRDCHADGRCAVRDRDGDRERPRLHSGHRAQPERAGNRHHPDRRGVQSRGSRALRDRRDPRRSEDQLRQADLGNLDQRLDPSGDGAGRERQDSPQALEPVRAVHAS